MSTNSMSVEGMRCKLQRVRCVLLPFSTSVHTDPNESMKGRGGDAKEVEEQSIFFRNGSNIWTQTKFCKNHTVIKDLLLILLAIAIW